MNHRIVNDVGYKKIYPMSLWEDDSFCHYCGRKASILNGLEWDHVPALNVKIPEEFTEIRKTLVRACRECNIMASDTPHLDYLERHFWLKAAYLRRYKSFIIQGVKEVDSSNIQDSYLLAVIHNSKIKYEEILNAIGFGIKDIDQIQSPILEVRTKKGQKISTLLINYLHGVPSEDNDEVPEPLDRPIQNISLEDLSYHCTLSEFTDFLADEKIGDTAITNQDEYLSWLKTHPMRANTLQLPENPVQLYKVEWNEIALKVSRICSQILKSDEAKTDVSKENQDYKQCATEICSYEDFIECLSIESDSDKLSSIIDYKNWISKNQNIALKYKIPKNPFGFYNKDWFDVQESIRIYLHNKCKS